MVVVVVVRFETGDGHTILQCVAVLRVRVFLFLVAGAALEVMNNVLT